MFGIANQLLAAIALTMVSTYLVQEGRRKWIFITVIPLAFVTCTTASASYQMVTGRFWSILSTGWKEDKWDKIIQGGLNITMVVFLFVSFAVILGYALHQWLSHRPKPTA